MIVVAGAVREFRVGNGEFGVDGLPGRAFRRVVVEGACPVTGGGLATVMEEAAEGGDGESVGLGSEETTGQEDDGGFHCEFRGDKLTLSLVLRW